MVYPKISRSSRSLTMLKKHYLQNSITRGFDRYRPRNSKISVFSAWLYHLNSVMWPAVAQTKEYDPKVVFYNFFFFNE